MTAGLVGRGGVREHHGVPASAGDSGWAMTAGNRSLVIGTEEAVVHALRAADGSAAWSYGVRGGEPAGPRVVVAGDTVYARVTDRVRALDLNGRRRWSATLGHGAGDDRHTPVVHGSRLYVPSGTGIAAVGVGG